MVYRILDCLAVNLAWILVYAVPPVLVLRLWRCRGARVPATVYGLVMALSLQAALGMLWNAFVGAMPRLELLVAVACWVLIGFGFHWGRTFDVHVEKPVPRSESVWLTLIILGGLVVRILHPLQAAYLGQSDAYVHLFFFKDILAKGHIRHLAYPAGYHWVMAAPSLLFGLDPYLVARYGGACLGLVMCLGVYTLLRKTAGSVPALIGTALAAAFPVFNILIKTGVGAFANQLGLAFMPFVLFAYVRLASTSTTDDARVLRVLFSGTLLGLAATVPMMLLRVALLIGCDSVLRLCLCRNRGVIFRRMLNVSFLALPAVLLLTISLVRAGPFWQQVTVESLTGERIAAEATDAGAAVAVDREAGSPHVGRLGRVVQPAFKDWVALKRTGLDSPLLNAIALGLVFVFAVFLVLGFIGKNEPWRVVGIFGLLTAFQTLTGVLEFSAYQRAGWHLMLSTVFAAAWVAHTVYTRVPRARLRHGLLSAGLAVCLAAGLVRPPHHAASLSSAEDLMVRVTRGLGFRAARLHNTKTGFAFDRRGVPGVAEKLSPSHPADLIVRSTQGTRRTGYWDVTDAVLPVGSPLDILHVRAPEDMVEFVKPDRQAVIFIDRARRLTAAELGAVGALSLDQARRYARWQHSLYKPNDWICEFLEGVEPAGRTRTDLYLSPNASVVILRSE